MNEYAKSEPWHYPLTLAGAKAALADECFETSRRIALAILQNESPNEERNEVKTVLHDALAHLGDLATAMTTLEDAGDSIEVLLRRYDDFTRASGYNFYRSSTEKDIGLTYEDFKENLLERRLNSIKALLNADLDENTAKLAIATVNRAARDAERRIDADIDALEELTKRWPTPPEQPRVAVPVKLSGRIRIVDKIYTDVTVTLGVETTEPGVNPNDVLAKGCGIDSPKIGEITTISAPLNADGTFTISGEAIPGIGFVAVTIPGIDGVPTRFLARDICVDGSPLADIDLEFSEWQSAKAEKISDNLPEVIELSGRKWHKQAVETLTNPFWHNFPQQDLRLDWPAPSANIDTLVWNEDIGAIAHQRDAQGRVLFFTDLPQKSSRSFGWYFAEDNTAITTKKKSMLTVDTHGITAVIDTGLSRFCIPWGSANDSAAPILAVMGPDKVWRGEGRWQIPGNPVISRTTSLHHDGPLEITVEVSYLFPTRERCSFTLTAHAGEEYLLVSESGEAIPGATMVMGMEDFRGGRGYLHWTSEGETPHWHTLVDADKELARLQESVPWWIPPAGFGWSASLDGLESHDQVSVFTRNRGQWIDHAFAAIAAGPPPGGHELDWPYPEMVGSTISMITVNSTTDGKIEMRFPRFAGERHWGLLASDFARGDGPRKEIYQVRHKTSFPRLDDLRKWQLDEPDRGHRPCLLAERDKLPEIRERIKHPAMAPLWEKIASPMWDQVRTGKNTSGSETLFFLVTGDPATGWRIARQLSSRMPAQVRALLLSRENGDVWSPVGGRCWAPQAEAYDAIVSSGAFSAAQEREMRACLLMAGEMFLSPDMMNWRYGGRNANFEADRVDAVGTIGLCFPDNPTAEEMVSHSVNQLGAAIGIYCTPGSGKWYENPACYYLQSLRCRMLLASHLAERGRLDLKSIPRVTDFVGWLMNVITPRLPASYDIMRDGCSYEQYNEERHVRRLIPMGDHAHLGPWIPEIAAITGRWLRDKEPELANALLWAWQEGGMDGAYHGSIPTLIAQLTPEDIAPAAEPAMPSRRLEGFGGVFRGKLGQPDEFMLMAKLGPGGYRYHRTEGSFVLVADGKPLIYDGGEAGDTWRHSTISYHTSRMPPAPGRIEKFATLPTADYQQGAFPIVLKPSDPIFLSDICEHQLVEEAYRRARIQKPAAARAWLWVKDDYVIMWDRLDIEDDIIHQWHLQVMAHDESGDLKNGLLFRGRFGTDLQLLLPAGGDRPWRVEHLPMHEYYRKPADTVAQRHLSVDCQGATDWLAVMRPLPPGAAQLTATPLTALNRTVGAHITGDNIDDRVVMGRIPVAVNDETWSFAGCAGAAINRGKTTRLILLGPGKIQVGNTTLESDGPAAELQIDAGEPTLHVDGDGIVVAVVDGKVVS
ncbi:MAG: hypothetical protein WCO98_04410 [bacterium]